MRGGRRACRRSIVTSGPAGLASKPRGRNSATDLPTELQRLEAQFRRGTKLDVLRDLSGADQPDAEPSRASLSIS